MVTLAQKSVHSVKVAQKTGDAVLVGKVAEVFVTLGGAAVTEMVVSCEHESARGKIIRERSISADIVKHSVGELNYTAHLTLGLVYFTVDRALSVRGWKSDVGENVIHST